MSIPNLLTLYFHKQSEVLSLIMEYGIWGNYKKGYDKMILGVDGNRQGDFRNLGTPPMTYIAYSDFGTLITNTGYYIPMRYAFKQMGYIEYIDKGRSFITGEIFDLPDRLKVGCARAKPTRNDFRKLVQSQICLMKSIR